jgi:hypothetical protein
MMGISVTAELDYDGTEITQFKKRPKIRLPFDSATCLSELVWFSVSGYQ